MDYCSAVDSIDRRTLLGTLATATAASTSGCVRRLRSITGWQSRSQVTLNIRAVPADADPYAFRIARRIAEWFTKAGIDASVEPLSEEQLMRSVLIDHEYEIFVGQLTPEVRHPDGLYPLLHSRFVDAPGWQNPFGYANLDVDAGLETQRRSDGAERREAVNSLQTTLARAQPFSTLFFPERVRAARDTRFENWHADALDSAMGYLQLEPGVDSKDEAASTLRMAVTDDRVTENLNPLSVEFRKRGLVMGFLYDALGYDADGTVKPWLADNWTFSVAGNRPKATVSLRDDVHWHDGRRLTASDVAFTFSLLDDTNGGNADTEESNPVPAPRFRGQSSLVKSVRAPEPQTAVFQFTECAPQVAASALTVPILPEHVWADRRTEASVSGFEFGGATEALVTDNVPPVGSGPLQFERNNPGESLVLEPYEDHFLTREDVTNVPDSIQGGPSFDRLRLRVVGSDTSATNLVVDGEADVTGTAVGASNVPLIGRTDDLELLVSRSPVPYIVGYNVRKPPLSNTRFRNTLVHLIDQAALAEDVFDGYAEPVASPLAGTRWLPSRLEWTDKHPVTPFVGSNGTLDVERARESFREAGYVYDDDGALLQTD